MQSNLLIDGAKALAPAAAVAAAVVESPILLAVGVCGALVVVGGGLVLAGVWAGKGFPKIEIPGLAGG